MYQMPEISRESAVVFASQFRAARLEALGDAEAFVGIIHTVERLGSYLKGRQGSLGAYQSVLSTLATRSVFASEKFRKFRNVLTPFDTLYELVRVARNDALHQGAFARHLTNHAIELAILLEDALSTYINLNPVVADFMARNPVCAEPWEPIGFIRQKMLANSFSCLPVCCDNEEWFIISDFLIANFLRSAPDEKSRKNRMAMPLNEARRQNLLELHSREFVDGNTEISKALDLLKPELPILLVGNKDSKHLLGVVTAFDLL
jgi:CBS domain-containing protein